MKPTKREKDLNKWTQRLDVDNLMSKAGGKNYLRPHPNQACFPWCWYCH